MASYNTKMRVYQNFGTTPAGTANNQNVFVFGPRYDLHRYTDPDEKELLVAKDYTFNWASGGAVEFTDVYPDRPLGYVLDVDFVRVFAENAYVATGAVFPGIDGIEIVGDYLDGVIRVVDMDVAVSAGEYICFQKDDNTLFMRVKTVVKPDESSSDTVITFYEGIPDEVVVASSDGPDTFVQGTVVFPAAYVGSYELPGSSWTCDSNKVVILDQAVEDNYAGVVGETMKPLVKADLFVSYRFMYSSSSVIETVLSQSDVVKMFGKITPDNPLAQGVYNAFLGGAPVVYACTTAGDTVEAFSEALKRAEMQKSLYYLVPMSQNKDVLDSVVSHVKNMSTEENKRWRLAFVCSAIESSKSSTVNIVGTGNYKNMLTLKMDAVETVYPGDTIVFNGVDSSRTFIVDRVLNLRTILTTDAYDPSFSVENKTATWTHVYTDEEMAEAISGKAKNYGTFRVVDCFPKTFGNSGKTYSSMYMAPILAGIAASVEPQSPITNKVIPGIDDLPDTYSKYDEASLDTIAAGGVMIAMQELRNSDVYVRKQLTTGASDGKLLTSELSCVKNADSITFAFDSVLDEFKGSYNVTPDLVELVRLRLGDVIHDLENNQTDPLIGPQLLDGSEVVDVYVDPSNATRIIAHVKCVVPAPFNEMDLYLSFDVTTDAGTEAV